MTLHALDSAHGGKARIYLDGDRVQTVSTQSSVTLDNHLIFTSPTLEDREHTLTIRLGGHPHRRRLDGGDRPGPGALRGH